MSWRRGETPIALKFTAMAAWAAQESRLKTGCQVEWQTSRTCARSHTSSWLCQATRRVDDGFQAKRRLCRPDRWDSLEVNGVGRTGRQVVLARGVAWPAESLASASSSLICVTDQEMASINGLSLSARGMFVSARGKQLLAAICSRPKLRETRKERRWMPDASQGADLKLPWTEALDLGELWANV